MKAKIFIAIVWMSLPILTHAQFTGPVVDRAELSVDEVREARVGTYAIVTGQIINQIREDYYTFQDDTGEIRVEISPELWENRPVNPQTTVRLFVEVDMNMFGRRYLWVESIEIPDSLSGDQ